MGKALTILGLQRTGTNFVEQCARQNWEQVQIRNTKGRGQIWKHDYKVDESIVIDPEKNFIWLTKHPYLWVESVMKSPVDTWKRWPQLKSSGNTDKQAIVKCKQYTYDLRQMGKLWTEHTEYWLNMMEKRKIVHVRYEELVESDEKTIELLKKFAGELQFKQKNAQVNIPKKVSQSEKFDEARRNKYKNMVLDNLKWNQIVILNSSLNHDIVKKVGYTLFESEDQFNKGSTTGWTARGNVPKDSIVDSKKVKNTWPDAVQKITPEEAAKRVSGR